MEIDWRISRKDLARIKAFIRQQADNALVRARSDANLARIKPQVRRERFWYQMVSMRLTSLQRSGPNSHVARFIRKEPFPLSYQTTCTAPCVRALIRKTLKDSGGIRFGDTIANQLAVNLQILEEGEWTKALCVPKIRFSVDAGKVPGNHRPDD